MDRASDAIRVDARDLRCRVVGEGGNLGLTRRARVEFAREGGLVNADFIDNSAGVDCSDHEVNLKILLGLAERRGELDRPARDELLREVTDDVVAHVLYDSFLQAQILSQEVVVSKARMYAYEDLMAGARGGRAARPRGRGAAVDGGDRRAPARRARASSGRSWRCCSPTPSARSRATCSRRDFCDDPWLERDLRDYFPGRVVERFGHLLGEHPLRRELIAMVNANMVVNSLGPTFVSQLGAERGAEPADVVARVPDRARGDRRRRALGRGRDAAARRSTGASSTELMRRRRPARRGRRALVPRPRRRRAAGRASSSAGGAVRAADRRAARDRLGRVARAPPRGRRRARRAGRAGGGRVGARARAGADAGARHHRRRRADRAARSRRSRARSTRSRRGSTSSGCSARSTSCRRPTRTQRWAAQAVREDCLDALAELARCALREADAGRRRRRPRSTPTSRRARRSAAGSPPSPRRSPSRARATCPR